MKNQKRKLELSALLTPIKAIIAYLNGQEEEEKKERKNKKISVIGLNPKKNLGAAVLNITVPDIYIPDQD